MVALAPPPMLTPVIARQVSLRVGIGSLTGSSQLEMARRPVAKRSKNALFFLCSVVLGLITAAPVALDSLRYVMREIIRLVSTAGTGYFYTTTKKKAQGIGKLEKKKFDPMVRKHVLFKEAKIK